MLDANSDEMSVYIDGQLVASAAIPDEPMYSPNFGTYLGRFGGSEPKFATGHYSELRVWNRPLTQPEIQANMGAQLTGSESGLVGYWRLDETSGGVALDLSPGGHDGNLANGAHWCIYDLPVDARHSTWGELKGRY